MAAGLDYEVSLAEMKTPHDLVVPRRRAVIRTDSKAVLGVVGKGYVPIQNRQCFGFLDSVVAEGELRYLTAGALGQGERIWLLAKLPGTIRIKNSEDVTDKFLLLSNSHDGTSSLRVLFTPIRVVCQNTLNAAEGRGRGQGISIAYKGDLAAKVAEAQEVLGLARHFYDDFEIKANRLANSYPTGDQLEQYFRTLYPDPVEGHRKRAENTRGELTQLFEQGIGQQISEIRHTWWAAYNAVTEYVDHHRMTRSHSADKQSSRRLASSWFGSGARLKGRALAAAFDGSVAM